MMLIRCSLAALVLLISSCADVPKNDFLHSVSSAHMTTSLTFEDYQGKPATAATLAVLSKARENLPKGDFLDGSNIADHTDEKRLADLPENVGPADYSQFDFLVADAPETVHPSLHAAVRKASADRGLFKIAEGIYQVRGDVAHITFVQGETGWVVLDAGTTREFAAGAWALLRKQLPGVDDHAIRAVVYSHSHGDHFGGVKGLITQAQVDAGEVQVIAPHGFMQALISESVIAGSAMSRRGSYHFGVLLDINQEGTGSAPIMRSGGGATTLIAPTVELPEGKGSITSRVVDGIDIHFMDISSAEAPAATLLFLPRWQLLFNSELITAKLHNIYTLRGAETRDALGWSKYINRIIHVWGSKIEHMTGPHGPTFSGREKINEFLRLQRDNYGFLHNQTMKLANNGVTLQDIGQSVEDRVPKSLSRVWHTRGYHGTYSHNARGVLNRYLGFYDGNPANLNPLKIQPEAVKYVEYMGGADAIMQLAQQDFESGEYRFVATVLNKLVMAEPNFWPARQLLADSFEQLGYQAEGPQWRDAYLTAAKELRLSRVLAMGNLGDASDLLRSASTEHLLDATAIRINSQKAEGKRITLQLNVSDLNEAWLVELSNSNLSYFPLNQTGNVDVTLTTNRSHFFKLVGGLIDVDSFSSLKGVKVEGSLHSLRSLIDILDSVDRNFPIVPLADQAS